MNIAHRGGAGLRPENTLAAFSHAIALGADGAELDVQLTKDGQVVVFHDHRLNAEFCRDAHGHWLAGPGPLLRDLTFKELCDYDIGRARPGGAYAQAHPDVEPCDGERIPLLKHVLALARGAPRPFRLLVELKTSFADRNLSASPEMLADAVLAALSEADYLDRSILVGFDWPGLLQVKRCAPQAQCWFTTLPQSWFGDTAPPDEDNPPSASALGLLRHWARTATSPWAGSFDAVNFGGSILEAIKAAGGDGWFPFYRDANDERIADARGLGLRIGAWTVNDASDMRRLASLDAICTDRPDILKSVLEG